MFGQSQFPVLLALSREKDVQKKTVSAFDWRLKYINTHLWKMSVVSLSGITRVSSFLHIDAHYLHSVGSHILR